MEYSWGREREPGTLQDNSAAPLSDGMNKAARAQESVFTIRPREQADHRSGDAADLFFFPPIPSLF